MEQWLSAWNIWFSGEKLPETFIIWNHSLTWWNRFGQFSQLLSALIVIAEIVGVERLRTIGKARLQNIDDGPIIKFFRGKKYPIILSAAFFVRLIYGLYVDNVQGYPPTDAAVLIEEIRLSLADLSIIFGIIVIPYIMFSLLNYAIVKIMSSEWSDRILKFIALFLGIIGFHFTLLAS